MIKLIGNEKIKNIIYRRYLKDCCLSCYKNKLKKINRFTILRWLSSICVLTKKYIYIYTNINYLTYNLTKNAVKIYNFYTKY